MEIRNPAFNAFGTIDCEINHPVHGWIPFTADPADPVEMGALVHAAAMEMGPAPYVPAVQATEVRVTLTPAQWAYFLDLTGFREALDAALAAMPKTTLPERTAWAMLRSVAYASESYGLPATLQLVGQVRGMGLPVSIPSDAEIEAAFMDAATFKGVESLLGGGA